MTQAEDFLSQELAKAEELIVERTRQLEAARQTINKLETVIHKATVIAGHIPFLCRGMTETSPEIEQAAEQLHQILVNRQA